MRVLQVFCGLTLRCRMGCCSSTLFDAVCPAEALQRQAGKALVLIVLPHAMPVCVRRASGSADIFGSCPGNLTTSTNPVVTVVEVTKVLSLRTLALLVLLVLLVLPTTYYILPYPLPTTYVA